MSFYCSHFMNKEEHSSSCDQGHYACFMLSTKYPLTLEARLFHTIVWKGCYVLCLLPTVRCSMISWTIRMVSQINVSLFSGMGHSIKCSEGGGHLLEMQRGMAAHFWEIKGLMPPDFSKLFKVQMDASKINLVTVLTRMSDKWQHMIAYASPLLQRTKTSYSVAEKEWRKYLYLSPTSHLTRWAILLCDSTVKQRAIQCCSWLTLT